MRPLPFLAVIGITACALLVGLTQLPHDPYVRFQQLSRESVHYLRVKWIYERIHFDPAPIDIAFIGTSHTQSGISSSLVEQALRKAGDGRHVVNFAVPHLGRDLEYLIARELIENRQIRTLVVEVQSMEARSPHPGFQRLATPADIAEAPLLINVGEIDNLARLPMRQLDLFAKTRLPDWFDMSRHFEASRYEGAHFDDTLRLHGTTQERRAVHPRAYFEEELKGLREDFAVKKKWASRASVSFLEENPLYRYNNWYLNGMIELARHRGVQVVFLYLPHLDAPAAPERAAWFAERGPILTPLQVMGDAELWQNADHLNYYGAEALSEWTAARLVELNVAH